MQRTDLIDGLRNVAGIPETFLTPEIIARLPERAAAAPWECTCRAVVWWRHADRRTREALRDTLPAALQSPSVPLVAFGVLVRYVDTPVGPYDEVIGGVGLLRRGSVQVHVPFIVVDSARSLVGGRVNWGFPKTLGRFEGEPADGTTMTARGEGWQIRVTPAAYGPAVPGVVPASVTQVGTDGGLWSTRMRGHGRARISRVTVEAEGEPTLTGWFPTGRCVGVVADPVTLRFAPARKHA